MVPLANVLIKRMSDDLFKNRRATISLGYIGLYEVASVFYGGEWEDNQEAKDFTVSIIKAMKENADNWSA